MSEIVAIVEWLRQRPDEADEAWIERLRAVFMQDASPKRDLAKADRIGDRLWQRYLAHRAADI